MQPSASENLVAAPTVESLSDVLCQYMDATKRLQQTHETLQHEIVRLRDELASKDRELELRRRLAALGEMAAGVAHEVRNPLGAIQLYTGLLRSRCVDHDLGEALELTDKIDAGIQAIEAVVQDTLALAPTDRQLQFCELRKTIEHVRDATLKSLTVCQVKLETSLDEEQIAVLADETGLRRVLTNLIVNAAEASLPGRKVRLQVCAVADNNVELRVIDEGTGLPEEIVHRIFDPFFTTKQQGTGLGLTIAHRLIEAFGGELTAANRPGAGAEFAITLPRAAERQATRQSETEDRRFSAA